MKNLDLISEELFNKIRGRFPSVTIGNVDGKVTNVPKDARYFDFDYKEGDTSLGKVSVSITDEAIEVMYSDNFVGEQDELTQQNWYDFLKELRQFSKKRLMKFDTRNINKSNLDRRDYEFLAANRGDNTMSESKMYGTNKLSYQNVDSARIVIKHTESVNPELGKARTRNIGKIYIESADGERFLYPYKHLTGARAMARHVAEGGKPFDDFGTHIVGLSEEMNKLRKFKSYMGRSAVMAESLSGYMDVVKERIITVRKTIESLQKPKFYAETIAAYEKPIIEDVPNDVAENWVDQLTIRQFNEELKDVFPYIYNLVSEATKAQDLSPEDLLGESQQVVEDVESWAKSLDDNTKKQFVAWARPIIKAADINMGDDVYDLLDKEIVNSPFADTYESWKDAKFKDFFNQITATEGIDDVEVGAPAETYKVAPGDTLYSIYMKFKNANFQGHGRDDALQAIMDENPDITDPAMIQPGMVIQMPYFMGSGPDGSTRGLPGSFDKYGEEIENSFEDMMGQFAEAKEEMCPEACCGKPVTECACGPDCKHCDCHEKNKAMKEAKGKDHDDDGDIDSDDYMAAKDKAIKKAMGKDDDELEEQKIPVSEFVLSLFDREQGTFPKGETAVLTAIEKDYGEQYIEPAKQFIERIQATFEQYAQPVQEPMIDEEPEGTVMEPTIEQDEEIGESGKDKYSKAEKKTEAQEIRELGDRLMKLAGL